MKHILFLMRHAHIDTASSMVGQKDISLSEHGIQQCLLWREFFSRIELDFVFTSPLQRARQSAELILKNKNSTDFIIKKEFSEISLGHWEGMKKEDIIKNHPEEWKKRGEDFYFNAPKNGESFYDVEKRVLPAFYNIQDEIKENIKNKNFNSSQKTSYSLIVAHQLVNRIILTDILNLQKSEIMTIKQDYACINCIQIFPQTEFLERKDCALSNSISL